MSRVKFGDGKLSFNYASRDTRKKFESARGASRKFEDDEFLLEDKVMNYGNDTADQIICVSDKVFIDGIDPTDIAQGEAGDCWFLSSLCSFANYVEKNEKEKRTTSNLLRRVINNDENNKPNNGIYIFTFYYFGEWHDVIIDDRLPLKIYEKDNVSGAKRQRKLKDSRGTTFYPDQVSDYWALLLEKAFAKFVGGYMNLEGGCPRWAVTYLSGGITTHDEIDESFSVQNALLNDGIFEYLEKIEDTSLIVVSNYDNDSPQNYALGLIAGHAYSVEDFEVINGTKIVKLRNPWGAGEWKGDWGDDWIIENADSKLRNINSVQRRKLDVDNLLKGTDDEDGMFWMAWTDFVREFEALTVCHLEDSRDQEQRFLGTFQYDGETSPKDKLDMGLNYLNPEKHLQFHLKVTGEKQFIQMQVTLDIPMKPVDKDDEDRDRRMVILAIHKMPKNTNNAKLDRPFEKFELYDMDLISPKLPLNRPTDEFKGYAFEYYDYNGWVYDLPAGDYIMVFASCPGTNDKYSSGASQTPNTNFIFRTRGKNFTLKHLNEDFVGSYEYRGLEHYLTETTAQSTTTTTTKSMTQSR